MKLARIFQDLEHLYDFQSISSGGHFVIQNETKILHRQVFIAIKIPCEFGEDICINEWYIKVYVKTWWTDRGTYGRRFIISQPRPRWEIKTWSMKQYLWNLSVLLYWLFLTIRRLNLFRVELWPLPQDQTRPINYKCSYIHNSFHVSDCTHSIAKLLPGLIKSCIYNFGVCFKTSHRTCPWSYDICLQKITSQFNNMH